MEEGRNRIPDYLHLYRKNQTVWIVSKSMAVLKGKVKGVHQKKYVTKTDHKEKVFEESMSMQELGISHRDVLVVEVSGTTILCERSKVWPHTTALKNYFVFAKKMGTFGLKAWEYDKIINNAGRC
jgi:hypothetical protein